jgi:hypothetical protein
MLGTRKAAFAVWLASWLTGCSLGIGAHAGTKIPVTSLPGKAPGFGAGPTLRAALSVPNHRAHWITTEFAWREHLARARSAPLVPPDTPHSRWQSDRTFLLGYEHRLYPEAATSLVFGGGVGAADDFLCGGFDCVGFQAVSVAAHVGVRHAFTSWFALHATARTRYVFQFQSFFLEVPVVLSTEFSLQNLGISW